MASEGRTPNFVMNLMYWSQGAGRTAAPAVAGTNRVSVRGSLRRNERLERSQAGFHVHIQVPGELEDQSLSNTPKGPCRPGGLAADVALMRGARAQKVWLGDISI